MSNFSNILCNSKLKELKFPDIQRNYRKHTCSNTAAKLKPNGNTISKSSIENFHALLVGKVSILEFSRSILKADVGSVLNKNPCNQKEKVGKLILNSL